MIEESLLKSNFVGRDGFRWWLGKVAPFDSDSNQLDQNNGGGWGNRVKVRIIGYHPFSEDELNNEQLPWAQILLPTTAGSGASNFATSHHVRPSDSVFGFFLDGDDAQLPVIVGVFGRTSEVSTKQYKSPFQPFTGYDGRIEKPDNSTLISDESNETNSQSQKSPRRAPSEVINDINQNTKSLNRKRSKKSSKFAKESPYYTGIGEKVVLGDSCTENSINSIIGLVNNLFSAVTGLSKSFLNIPLEISKTVSSIAAAANSLVSNMFGTLSNAIIPILQGGLGNLYNIVFSSTLAATLGNVPAAVAAGIASQTAFLEPVKLLQDALFCGIGAVLNSLTDLIEKLLKSVLKNAKKFVTCVGSQFVGSLINTISQKIEKFINDALGGVTRILTLGGGIDILGVVTDGISAVEKIASFLDCNQNEEKCEGMVNEYVIGKGVVDAIKNTNAIIKNAKISQKIGEIAVAIGDDVNDQLADALGVKRGKKYGLPDCDTKISFKRPKIRIFGGGGGKGAKAVPILGSFVKNADGRVTASIVGVKLLDHGKDYKYPPFIEIEDPSGVGVGAIARSIVDLDECKVKEIYMVSIGENYPIGTTQIDETRVPITAPGGKALNPITFEFDDRDERPTTVGVGSQSNIGISEVLIINSGTGYSSSDILVDEDDNQIGISTINLNVDSDGQILNIISENPFIVTENGFYPEIRVRTSTGSGAVLKPSIGIVTSINNLTQIIDCI
jgi:hypothetical protein